MSVFKKNLVSILLLLFWAAMMFWAVHARAAPTYSKQAYDKVQSGGSDVTRRPTLNMSGSGVSCVDDSANNKTTCTITAGAGTTTFIQQQVDFGCSTGPNGSAADCGNVTQTVTTGAVVSASKIVCNIDNVTGTADHPAGQEDPVLEGLHVDVTNIVNATSFDVDVAAADTTWGKYLVNCVF